MAAVCYVSTPDLNMYDNYLHDNEGLEDSNAAAYITLFIAPATEEYSV